MVINVLEYLENTAERIPDEYAFRSSDCSMTFAEVLKAAKAVGSGLISSGTGRRPVAVLMERSPEMASAFYGCAYSGSPYVPLDREMPRIRLELIMEKLRPAAIIFDAQTSGLAAELSEKYGIPLFGYVDLAAGDTDQEELSRVRRMTIDTDPLYIIYTSGSTGVPKGVAVSHRSVIDYAETFTDAFGIDRTTVFGSQTAFYFDGSLKELYSTPKTGAVTWIIPKKLFMFPVKLVEFLNEHKINTICWVSSALSMVSSLGTFDEIKPRYLRTVIFSGEVFPARQCMIWKKALPGARFFNLYGPTETTGTNIYYEVKRDFEPDEVIPMGRPYPNTSFLILDEEGAPVQEGRPGELCIRGASLALGYWNDPVRTAEVFIQNPTVTEYPDRIYKTGDVVRLNQKGELEFVDRADRQIKHMGQRLEPGEVELAAERCEGVGQACCIGDRRTGRLTLFYVGSCPPEEVTSFLRTRVPRYMVPTTVKKLDMMPLLTNGKLDRGALKNLI